LGRILIPLFLHEKKILHRPMFYLSSWLEARRDAYIDHLRPLGVHPSAWNRWITFFLTGLEEQARANTDKARAILDLYARMKARVLSLTHSQYAVPLLDQMFVRPVFQANHLKFGSQPPTRGTVANLLRAMQNGGVVRVLSAGGGRRAAVYAFAELINLCEGKKVVA
jgi:hypothetical protein